MNGIVTTAVFRIGPQTLLWDEYKWTQPDGKLSYVRIEHVTLYGDGTREVKASIYDCFDNDLVGLMPEAAFLGSFEVQARRIGL